MNTEDLDVLYCHGNKKDSFVDPWIFQNYEYFVLLIELSKSFGDGNVVIIKNTVIQLFFRQWNCRILFYP